MTVVYLTVRHWPAELFYSRLGFHSHGPWSGQGRRGDPRWWLLLNSASIVQGEFVSKRLRGWMGPQLHSAFQFFICWADDDDDVCVGGYYEFFKLVMFLVISSKFCLFWKKKKTKTKTLGLHFPYKKNNADKQKREKSPLISPPRENAVNNSVFPVLTAFVHKGTPFWSTSHWSLVFIQKSARASTRRTSKTLWNMQILKS